MVDLAVSADYRVKKKKQKRDKYLDFVRWLKTMEA